MLSLHRAPLWVGVNPHSSIQSSQGTVWVEHCHENTGKCHISTIGLIIRPSNVIENGLSYSDYRQVVSQLRKMGIIPTTIEIRGIRRKYVYSGKRYQLQLVEKLQKRKNQASTDEMKL